MGDYNDKPVPPLQHVNVVNPRTGKTETATKDANGKIWYDLKKEEFDNSIVINLGYDSFY